MIIGVDTSTPAAHGQLEPKYQRASRPVWARTSLAPSVARYLRLVGTIRCRAPTDGTNAVLVSRTPPAACLQHCLLINAFLCSIIIVSTANFVVFLISGSELKLLYGIIGQARTLRRGRWRRTPAASSSKRLPRATPSGTRRLCALPSSSKCQSISTPIHKCP